MAQAIRTGQFTPADEVRELLGAGENYIPDIKGSKERAVAFLAQLDRLAELWPQVEAMGADLRPEAGRWETLLALTSAGASECVRDGAPAPARRAGLGGAGRGGPAAGFP